MYGCIRRFRIRSGSLDEMTARVRSGLVPLLEKTPGFVAYYLVNADDNKTTSFTVGESRAAIDELNRVALDWVKKNFANELSDPEMVIGEMPIALTHQHA